MPRRAASITQADVARTIRAAMQAGAAGVTVKPDGTIHIDLQASKAAESQEKMLERDEEIVL
jgi:hypothetical protein